MSVRYGKQKSMRGFPVGSICPWPTDSSQIPMGWVLCDGKAYDIARYPLLYDVIGNVYGGTTGTTFSLPELLQSRAVVDIYPGHYSYLKTIGAAHYDADSTTIASDPFWNNVGETFNNSGTFNHQSTIDVIGVLASKPNLVASVKGIIFSKGEFTETYGIHPRKLSDRHISAHNHGTDAPEDYSSSWVKTGVTGDDCCGTCVTSTTFLVNDCVLSNTKCGTSLTWGGRNVPDRPAVNNDGNGIQGSGQGTKGGAAHATSGFSLNSNTGNGEVKGDLYARTIAGSNRSLAGTVSLATAFNWSDINGHTHEPTEATFRCNVGAQKDYTFYDVSTTGVDLVQAPPNQASINMNSKTANLTMLYIIRAF